MDFRTNQPRTAAPLLCVVKPLWSVGLACAFLIAYASALRGCQQTQSRYVAPTTLPDWGNARLVFLPASGSHVELRGITTIGGWTSHSADVRGQIVLDTDMSAIDSLFDQVQSAAHRQTPTEPQDLHLLLRSPAIVSLSVPVITLRGDSEGMENDLHNALQARQHPMIDYAFKQLQSVQIQSNGDHRGLNLCILGQLAMAGARRPIAMDVFIYRDSAKHFHARTQSTLFMTDFGVTPPTALFGLIHAQNRLKVTFDLPLDLANHSPGTRPSLTMADAPRR